jgi:threonine/homoserine/homoserine lactone efflux protein
MDEIIIKKKLNSLFKIFVSGFSLGMILQLSIGPVCLYVFKSAAEKGFFYSELIIIGVFLIDAFYIFWAIFGISTFLKNEKTKIILKIIGFIILLFFGINIILSEITKMNLIPSINIINKNLNNPFLNGLLLTLSNPLTIICWIGIFSAKIIEKNYSKNEVVIYGFGALIPTIIFLSTVVIIGIIIKTFLPQIIISSLNILVGLIIIYFSFKTLLKKDNN